MANQNTKVINIARLHPISKIIPTNTKNTVNGKAVADYVEDNIGGSKIEVIIKNRLKQARAEIEQFIDDNFIRGAVVTPSTLPTEEDRKEDFNYFIIPDEEEKPKPEEVRYVRDISYFEPVVYGADDNIDYSNVKRIYIDIICSTSVAYDLDSISLIINTPKDTKIFINNKEMTWGYITPDYIDIDPNWFNKEGYDLASFMPILNDSEIKLVAQYEKQYNSDMALNITVPSDNFRLNLFDYIGGSEVDDAVIDWGDGSDIITIDPSSSSLSHTYSAIGNYQLKITGKIKWKGKSQTSATSSLSQCLTSIELLSNNSPIVDIGEDAFGRFSSLTNIPSGLFDNCTKVDNFKNCFYGCILLQSIPEGLFDKCTEVTSFYGCFGDCRSLQSIPEGLFNKCIKVDSFGNCFFNCNALQSIPIGLFNNNTLVTDFHYCFPYCKSLQSIPAGLFDKCTEVTDFGYCFAICESLQSIPEGLFDKCIEVTNFANCFQTCSSLQSIPNGLFNNCKKVNDFTNCFYYNESITNKLPELWVTHPNASHRRCFYECTKASNYQNAVNAGWA